jgi:cytoskeleton protein RodZ
MSETPQAAAEPTTAGAMLRAAREQQGLHIAALAAAIKVAPRKLDALERDRWGDLPDATFTRALAQTVCRTLKIDPRPVLAKLPQADAASLEHAGGSLNMPFRDKASRDEPGIAGAAIRPMIGAAVLLMIAALVLYLVPSSWWRDGDDGVVAPGTTVIVTPADPAPAFPAETEGAGEGESTGQEPAGSEGPGSGPVGEPVSAGPGPGESPGEPAVPVAAQATPPGGAASSPAQAGAAATPTAAPTAAPIAVPTPVSTPAAATTPPASAATAAAPVSGVLQLATMGESWIEVRDANDRVLLSRLLAPGERVGLDGDAPLRVVVGNAAVTELQYRGRTVELAPLTRDNVARLTLR